MVSHQHQAKLAETYRGWKIYRGSWPYLPWYAYSPDYDAEWCGEEDGWCDNGEKAEANTYDGLLAEIDQWFEDNGPLGLGA